MKLTDGRIVAGVWEGVVAGSGETPQVVHQGQVLPATESRAGENERILRVPIPTELLNEGVNTFVIRAGGETLGSFTILAGDVLADDLRAEIGLLRAELDLLKRAFRRQLA